MLESDKEKLSHRYDYHIDINSDTAPARVARLVGFKKQVLEVGAGPGSISRFLQHNNGCSVTALEIDDESVQSLKAFCTDVYQVDLNDSTWPNSLSHKDAFEVVIAADVLEHLYDPLASLNMIKELLSDDGCVIVSLPHIGHLSIYSCLLEEDFQYGDVGLLDRTHIRFFGIKNIQQLFEDANLKIVHAEFVVRNPEDTEFSDKWSKTASKLNHIISENPFCLVYQVVVKAVKIDAAGEAISLTSLPVVYNRNFLNSTVKNYLRTHLNPKILSKLSKMAKIVGLK